MKLRIIKQSFLEQILQIPDKARANWYQKDTCWLDDFFGHQNWQVQTKIDVPGNIELVREGNPPDTDLENSIQIYNALQDKLTPVQASDARLWTYLCHDTFWDYMKWRWPPIQNGTIESRYLVKGSNSRALSRNGIARLWWFAHLTYDKNRANPYELTGIFLQNQDIQHNLIERNLGRNKQVLHAALVYLKSNPDINGKEDYVKLGKTLNRLGGIRLLDCLTAKEITSYLEKVFKQPKT